MIVWVFACGAYTEAKGFIPFLRKHFPDAIFEQRFPVNIKPAPARMLKERKRPPLAEGASGRDCRKQVKLRLAQAFANQTQHPDLIVFLDDLDCHNLDKKRQATLAAFDEVLEVETIAKIIGFAKPEIESWIIADWEGAMRKIDYDHIMRAFRSQYDLIRRWLKREYDNDLFANPEAFGSYDEKTGACKPKLSVALVEACKFHGIDFSKQRESPALLKLIEPDNVVQKCPVFRQFWNELNDHLETA